ncbi:glycine zipper 2TM domain-containing protein [Dryocola sp. LX212]|jgi:outer membrane lipoprotein SlyB
MIVHKSLLAVPFLALTLTGCINSNRYAGDVYQASDAKAIQTVSYGTVTHVRPVQLQAGGDTNVAGGIGGAVLGGFLGNTIGGGKGRSLATATGAVAGGMAGQKIQGEMNKEQGVELEIRKDDGKTVMVVQKQGPSVFTVGERVALASDGHQVTVSPR